jgi:hypothetical protein
MTLSSLRHAGRYSPELAPFAAVDSADEDAARDLRDIDALTGANDTIGTVL